MKAKQGRILILILLCINLSSCAFIEWLWLMPWAKDSLKISPGTTTKNVFSCAESALNVPYTAGIKLDVESINKNLRTGVFESENFSELNQMGFRIRLQHFPDDNIVEIELKGAAVYYSDLGVDEGMVHFKHALKNCLEHSNKNISGNFFKRNIKIHD
jgi:hypothetical protein